MSWETLFNQFVQALVPVVVAFAAAMLGLVLEQVRRYVQARVTTQQFVLIEYLALTAVSAAEQVLGSAEGRERKEYAVRWLERELAQRGVRLDLAQLDAWIESAVQDLQKSKAVVEG